MMATRSVCVRSLIIASSDRNPSETLDICLLVGRALERIFISEAQKSCRWEICT